MLHVGVRVCALGLMAIVLALVLLLLVATGRPSLALPGITERVSVASDGTQGNDGSGGSAISGDGRYVAFTSGASNLVAGDTNLCTHRFFTSDTYHCPDVFVHDRQTGVTERVSVDSAGNQANGDSRALAISDDGRYVAFQSYASNLVVGDTNVCSPNYNPYNCPDVFVHDRQTGVTERVSVASDGTQGNDSSGSPAISGDGRYVAFYSSASNLVPGDTAWMDVFVHDRQTGVTERVSVDSAGNDANRDSGWPAISADGRYVAFESGASNLVSGDTNDATDVFVHDRQTGITEWVSVDSAGSQGNGHSDRPSISADGRYVAFESWASNLVPGDANVMRHVFVHDRQTGVTERVSVDSAGNQGNGLSEQPSINADGRYVAFLSEASNLVTGDTNVNCSKACEPYNCEDVFVHDRQTGVTERASVDSGDNQANLWSYAPAISGDGGHVAFESAAFNLVPGDINGTSDVFVRDRLGIPPQGAVRDCPQPGKWAISVWDGPDGTEAGQALATCALAVAAAYYIDPDTQVWSRWFAGRADISNLAPLDDMQAVVALGSIEAAVTPTPCLPPTPTAAPPTLTPTPTETPHAEAAANRDTDGLSDAFVRDGGGIPVGRTADSARVPDSPTPNHLALAGLAVMAVAALTAGGWYAGRRWLR